MLTRIWKEDAKGRVIPGSLRVVDVPMRDDPKELPGFASLEKDIKPYGRQYPPLHVQAKKRRHRKDRRA